MKYFNRYAYSGLGALCFLLSSFMVQAQGEVNKERWRKGIVVDEFVFIEAPFASCHAATIAETPEGMVAAWFGGAHERNPDVGIWMSRLKHGEWTPPVEVANGIINDTLRYATWNPVLYQVPGGDLLLFYKVGPRSAAWWGMMIRSTDGGETWSRPEELPEGVCGSSKNKPIPLKNGKLLFPSSDTGESGWRVHFETTTDFGKTWQRTEPINSIAHYEAIQPTILEYEDGSLQALSRSKNRVISSTWSYDNGETWSLMQPSGLPNNNSGIDGVTLTDGTQFMVYNHVKTAANAHKGYRTPLNAAVSKDGKHWEAVLVLEDSEISQYSYPSVIQASDGLIHIVYTWRRERIKHVVVDPGQLEKSPIILEQWPEK